MKAVIVQEFSASGEASLGDLADPLPGAGEVVVDLAAIDVNFPDLLYVTGKYQKLPPLPFTPGLGGAGTVLSIGLGVDTITLGQRVLVLTDFGTYAEKICVPADRCYPMPLDMPFDKGAALGLVYQTAYFALLARGQFQPGDTVLVLGASGGVGMAAVQLAKVMGAGKVIAASRGDEGRAFAMTHGADIALDSNPATLRDQVRAATGGQGVDIVIDPVGGATSAAALRALAWCGRMVVVGFASGEIPKFDAGLLLVKNITVAGLQWTDYRDRQKFRAQAAQQEIFALWQAGKLFPQVTCTLPLERYAEALAAIERAGVHGKLILLIKPLGEME